MRVVVFGATGTIGRALVPLLAREHDVVAVSRHAQNAADGFSWARAEATDPASVAAALAGADVAYYLVHSLGSSDFERRDRVAAETVAAAAEAAGLRQIVYLGGLGDDAPDLSAHLRSRIETGEALAQLDLFFNASQNLAGLNIADGVVVTFGAGPEPCGRSAVRVARTPETPGMARTFSSTARRRGSMAEARAGSTAIET